MANADRLIEVFNEAKARPTGAERERFLAEACAGDPQLKEQILSLLQAHEGAGDFLKNAILSPTVVLGMEKPGDKIGRYKLLQQLGEGGCGVVYMAEQTEPVRRKVALKVIKLGMDTKQVVARFEAERQALALMDHPNIAKIYDAGCTERPISEPERDRSPVAAATIAGELPESVAACPSVGRAATGDRPRSVLSAGRPYFVMELVKGIKITDYCDQNQLSTTERLDLFIQVCQAVQHAHQKGIIHRDLKPSNILVTQHDTVAVPKVIDFGIAKATSDQPLTDKTVFTAFEQFMGTPAYMSPEQAQLSGLDIDTRTDIYSLGVLLYELLTGQPPFDPEELMKSGLEAMRKTIREQEPARPSTRLTQELAASGARESGKVGKREGEKVGGELRQAADSHSPTFPPAHLPDPPRRGASELQRLITLVRGDLDWIVMKCLEKDRTRRYETANGLAADIKRHLGNEPVVARPPSRLYEFQKTVRRHKFGFAAAAAVLLALAGGAVVSTWQAMRATREQRTAVTARQQADADRTEAVKARADEAQLRLRAEAQERAARRLAYASHMNLAQQALAQNNLGRAQELLNRHRPEFVVPASAGSASGPSLAHPDRLKAGLQTDLRGWEWRYLWQQCQSEALFTLCQKTNAIFSLSVSPDGKRLAIGEGEEGKLSIWDLPKREEIIRFPADVGPVFAVFSPRERLLAFSSGAGRPNQPHRVRLWDGDTNRIVAELVLENPGRGLAFSGDGRTLATLRAGSIMSGREGELALWKVPEGGILARHPAGRVRWGQGHPFAITPDLSAAAYVLWLETISVMDLRTGQERWKAKLSDDYVTALALSPDGKTLASAGGFAPSPIRLWDMVSGKMIGESSASESQRGYTCSLVFSPDGETLASGSSDQTIRLWDTRGLRLRRTLLGHKGEVWSLVVLPDNRTLVSGGKDGSVLVWDMAASRRASPHVRLPEDLMAWSFVTNSQAVLTCDRQGRVAQWQGDYLAEERLFEMGTNVAQAFFVPHRSIVLARLTNGTIQVWDLQTRGFSRELTFPLGRPPKCFCIAQGNTLLIVNLATQLLHHVDLTTWQKVRTWPGPVQLWTSAISPDGQWCVTLGRGGASMINDLNTGRALAGNLEIKAGLNVAFSPDGKLLAAASDHGFARIWDATTLQPLADLRGFLQGVHSLAFSPDGQRLVTSSDGKEAIKLWDVESREELLTIEGQGSMFELTAFSPDGAILGSMNAPGETQRSILHLWRAPSWAEIEAAEKAEAPHQNPTQPR